MDNSITRNLQEIERLGERFLSEWRALHQQRLQEDKELKRKRAAEDACWHEKFEKRDREEDVSAK